MAVCREWRSAVSAGQPWSVYPDADIPDLDAYTDGGGGEGLRAASDTGGGAVIDLLVQARLRGRGGGGYPVGDKWRGVQDAAAQRGDPVFVVANGAEGEPGSAKDRLLLQRTPFAVVEGVLIALHALGARAGTLAVAAGGRHAVDRLEAASGRHAVDRLEAAVAQMRAAGWTGAERLSVRRVPDVYLSGEETALLEALEGRPPLPRVQRPDQFGLGAGPRATNPTLVGNVETFAHVARLLRDGPADFRRCGTATAPGTMGFTVVGDVEQPGVSELPLGTPLRALLERAGASDVQAVAAGASGGLLPPAALDTSLDFDALRAVGAELGSGAFIVLGGSRCIVQVLAALTGFLAAASCGQCLACSGGTDQIAGALDRIDRGRGSRRDLDAIRVRVGLLTDGVRCGLPAGAQRLVAGALRTFADEIEGHLGRRCPSDRPLRVDDLAAGGVGVSR